MTVHRSLRGVNTLVGQRSVLTRVERIQQLSKAGSLDTDEGSAYGLPKVRTKFKSTSGKKAKALEDAREIAMGGGEDGEGGEGSEGEAKEEGES